MATMFDAFDAKLQSAVNKAFGEAIRIIPQTRGQYGGPLADTARPPADVRAVFSTAPVAETMAGQRTGSELNGTTMFAHSSAEVWLDAETVAGLGYALRKGDAVQLLDRPGQPVYEISRPAPTDRGDVALLLVATQ